MLGVYGALLVLALWAGGHAQRVEILKPIRDTGDEVGLIFTSVYPVSGERYRKLAQAIQAASDLRVWVAINDRAYHAFAGRFRLPRTPEESIKKLRLAGMTSENFIGVAHGEGGEFISAAAKDSDFKAVILLGSTLPRTESLRDYPLPLLTLAAELDGVVRVTRMAVEFEKLKKSLVGSSDGMYRTPILLIKGANHSQFASGTLPDFISSYDLVADNNEEETHTLVGKHVHTFLTATFGSSAEKVNDAKTELEAAFTQSEQYFQPILDVRALDIGSKGNRSSWTVRLQEHIADDFADQISVVNTAGAFSLFYDHVPYISEQNGQVVVHTHSSELYRTNNRFPNTYLLTESPFELDVKLKTRDAIWEALTEDDNATLGPASSLTQEPATCKSLNELALQVALESVSPEALSRYTTKGRPVILEEDSNTWNLFLWNIAGPGSDDYPDGFHVRGVAYISPVTSKSNPGMMYCKLISPYKALEWVLVDSLKTLPQFG